MLDQLKFEKPRTVLHAEWALWVWTVWTCLFGVYQSWIGIPDLEEAIANQLQGMVVVGPDTLLEVIIVSYGVLAVASAWVVLKIGAGKNWARTSLLLGFALDAFWMALPPYQGWASHLADIPDLCLQLYALYLLYTLPGNAWFKSKAETI